MSDNTEGGLTQSIGGGLTQSIGGRKAAFFAGVPQKKQDQPIKMRFGKYKGKLLEDVIEFDPEYAKWLYELDNAKEFKKSYALLDAAFRG
jgi:hypothetical protein